MASLDRFTIHGSLGRITLAPPVPGVAHEPTGDSYDALTLRRGDRSARR